MFAIGAACAQTLVSTTDSAVAMMNLFFTIVGVLAMVRCSDPAPRAAADGPVRAWLVSLVACWGGVPFFAPLACAVSQLLAGWLPTYRPVLPCLACVQVMCFFILWLSFTANVRENAWEFGVLRSIGVNVSALLLSSVPPCWLLHVPPGWAVRVLRWVCTRWCRGVSIIAGLSCHLSSSRSLTHCASVPQSLTSFLCWLPRWQSFQVCMIYVYEALVLVISSICLGSLIGTCTHSLPPASFARSAVVVGCASSLWRCGSDI